MSRIRVHKVDLDWLAECHTHTAAIWCADQPAALEAAYGHAAMAHPRICDHEFGWHAVGRPEEHKCLGCGAPMTPREGK